MGTVIMYDCLKRATECPAIDGLFTVGSSLGNDEIQDKLKGQWINIYDTLDPVTGFDGNFANDYRKNWEEIIEVINEANFLHGDIILHIILAFPN